MLVLYSNYYVYFTSTKCQHFLQQNIMYELLIGPLWNGNECNGDSTIWEAYERSCVADYQNPCPNLGSVIVTH